METIELEFWDLELALWWLNELGGVLVNGKCGSYVLIID